ncbi:hypothetical protein [Chitinibacter sp. ZOR0017]|uniref:hypothetical protein n=1 Tax=Chitinibacter sp. ZOR0017 TaxID=1339254 RepID=UPI0006487228|nr:hypothetical protein [Chitinibacter sp. ZOR0017]
MRQILVVFAFVLAAQAQAAVVEVAATTAIVAANPAAVSVSLSAPALPKTVVPAPTAPAQGRFGAEGWALLGIGALALLGRRRKRWS